MSGAGTASFESKLQGLYLLRVLRRTPEDPGLLDKSQDQVGGATSLVAVAKLA